MLGLFAVLSRLTPARFGIARFRPTYLFVIAVLMAFFAFLHGLILLAAIRPETEAARAIVAAACLFLALIGNVMGKFLPNPVMGIRTPWTFKSERVWNQTHRLGAWMFVGASALGFVTSLLGWFLVTIALIMVAALVPVGYSLYRYKELERAGLLVESDATPPGT